MTEIWLPCAANPIYEVSNLGQVRTIARETRKNNTVYRLKSKILKQRITRTYPVVTFGNKFVKVHQLVAKAFIPNPNNYPFINHKDGDKSNNCANNLEWCTPSQNVQHAYDTGLIKPYWAGKKGKDKYTKYLEQFSPDGQTLVKRFDRMRDVELEGFVYSSIVWAANREKIHKGFLWRSAVK